MIGGEHVGAETVRRIVGDRNGLILAGHPVELGDRPEELRASCGGPFGNIGQNSRRIVGAIMFGAA